MVVGPDLEVAERAAARFEPVDRSRLAVADDHSGRVVGPVVILGFDELPQVRIALAVARPHGERQALFLPPLPELILEGVAVPLIGQLEKGLLFGRQDDRRDELRQPLAVLVRKGFQAFRFGRNFGVGRSGSERPGAGENQRQEKGEPGRYFHGTKDLNHPVFTAYSFHESFTSSGFGR